MPSTLQALADLRPPRRRVRLGDAWGELRVPPGAEPHPVAVSLHGGSWRPPRTRRYMRPLCADLARHGWATLNVEYRRVGEGGGWPATFADVAAAFDALPGIDAPLDLARVAAVGHSAGGQLALWAATRDDAAVPITVGVVALAAPSDLEARPAVIVAGEPVFDLMGAAPNDAPDDRYARTNPIRRLPLGVPVLLVHGDADTTVPVRRSRDFAAAARAAGDADVTLVEVPGADHRAVVDPRRAEWAGAVRWLAERAAQPSSRTAT